MTIVKKLSQATIVLNIINFSKTIVLICPGGGYQLLSNRESGPISVRFNCLGYNTAILYYSLAPCKPTQPYLDGVEALKELTKDYDNIIVVGFSAGGHLAGLLGTRAYEYNVKGMVLCYPVISLGEYRHDQTAYNFMGGEYNEKLINEYSVNKCVSKNTVPCYVWTTENDELVDVHNTYMLIDELKKNGIYYESMIYPNGKHGLALADETAVVEGNDEYLNPEIAKWPYNVDEFIKRIIKK